MKKIRKFLLNQNQKETLRLITCGSVDDGKSTLLGRLIYETGNLQEDQSDYLSKLPFWDFFC